MVLSGGRMRVAELRPRDRTSWRDGWGQVGRRAYDDDPRLTPGGYYGELLLHMAAGGEIEPLVVGPWISGLPGQTYVFDGHHRFALARHLGWVEVPITDAGPEYTMMPAVREA